MMRLHRSRLEFTSPTKRAALERSCGICECGRVPYLMQLYDNKPCGLPVGTGNTFYEHVNPDGLAPDNSLSNCATLTKTCWLAKSNGYDKPVVARAKRREDRHAGIRPIPYQPIPGTRASGVKLQLGGGPPIDRETGRPWHLRNEPELPEPNGIIASPFALYGRVPAMETDPVIVVVKAGPR